MKNAIANFITKHPFLTYWLAASALGTLRIMFRGYEPKKIDKSKLEEVEVIEENEKTNM